MNSASEPDSLWDWEKEKQKLAKKKWLAKIAGEAAGLQQSLTRQNLVNRLVRLTQNKGFSLPLNSQEPSSEDDMAGLSLGDTTNYVTKQASPLAALATGGGVAAAAWFLGNAAVDVAGRFAPPPSPAPVASPQEDQDTQYSIGLLREEDLPGTLGP